MQYGREGRQAMLRCLWRQIPRRMQNPLDLPDPVLGQLGNRMHHALRAFTPKDQKNVKGAAQTLRPNPAFDTVTAITELRIGEALVSMLDMQGSPMPVERARNSLTLRRNGR